MDEPASLSELLARYNVAFDRQILTKMLDRARAAGDSKKAATAEGALARLPADVDVLDSMRAGAEIVSRLTGWRWIHIEQAREEGRSWTEIGEALNMSKQAAWELYKTSIELQEEHVPTHDRVRARAALGGDQPE